MRNTKKKIGSTIGLVLLALTTIASIPHVIPSAKAVTWATEYPAAVTPGWDTYPNLFRLPGGTLLLFFTSNQFGTWSIFSLKSLDSGTTWSPIQQVTGPPNDQTGSALARVFNGTLFLFYSSDKTGRWNIVYRVSSDEGLAWGAEISTFPNLAGTDNFRAAALTARDGTIWVVWHANVAGNWDLYYATSSNGGATWNGPNRLTTDPANDLAPSIAQGPDGRIWVAWHSYRTGSATPEVFIKSFDGTSWSSERQLTFDPSFNIMDSLAIADDGTFWLVWSTDRNNIPGTAISQCDVYYKYSYDNGATWSGDNQATTNPADDVWASIAQTGSGRFGVAFASPRTATTSFDIYFGQLTTPDLGVSGVNPVTTKAAPGDLVKVYVTMINHGATTETPTAKLYANNTLVASFTFTFGPGSVLTWGPNWNTTGMPLGRYFLTATITPAVGETNLADNQLTTGPVYLRIPDIAVSSVSLARNWVYQGNNVTASVTVKNLDFAPETFTVQLRVDGSPVAGQLVSVAPFASQTLSLTWTTTGATFGNHTISAYAVPLSGEVNTANNLLVDGNVRVLIPGDINQDGKVNLSDFFILLGQLGSTSSNWDPFWGPRSDINNDQKVNLLDAFILIAHLGQTGG